MACHAVGTSSILVETAKLNAGVAQLVERYLAKVNVVSSNLITRSNNISNDVSFCRCGSTVEQLICNQ